MRGLYAIVDVDFLTARGIAPLALAERLLPSRPAALQLRAKHAGAREGLAWARSLVALAAPFGVPVFINDRPDLAVLAQGAGVHLGQTDLRLADVRQLWPSLAVGLSTHTLDQLDEALAERPTYVAFGPVFATQSKADPDPVVGLEALAEAARRCRRAAIPLIAIGGISEERAALVAAWADAAALISALLPPGGLPEVEAGARRLQRVLAGAERPVSGGAGAQSALPR